MTNSTYRDNIVVCRFSAAYYISMLCCVLILGIELTQIGTRGG